MLPSHRQQPTTPSRDVKDCNNSIKTMQRKSCHFIFNENCTKKLQCIFILLTIASLMPTPATCNDIDIYDDLTIEESQADYRTELYENPTSINEGVDSDLPVKVRKYSLHYLFVDAILCYDWRCLQLKQLIRKQYI